MAKHGLKKMRDLRYSRYSDTRGLKVSSSASSAKLSEVSYEQARE